MELLKRHDWPGNIRELQNVIERGVIMTTGCVLSTQTTAHMRRNGGIVPIRTLVDAERAHIAATLRETNGVVGGPRGAAAQLGLPRTTLIARMQRLGISGESSGQRAGQSHRPFVSVPGGLSDVARCIPEETRDDSAAVFPRMRAAAGGTW
jgi:formate hydrogenlyase transcriptional activator